MPEISRFYGIVIKMFFADHPPPHFHAEYGDFAAVIAIRDGRVIAGELPSRALELVYEWCDLHRTELLALWDRAVALQALERIAPLP